MKTMLAIAFLCGATLAACSTTNPPPAEPAPKIAAAAPAEVPSKAQPAETPARAHAADTVKAPDAAPKKAPEAASKKPAVPKASAKAAAKSAPSAPAKAEAAAPPQAETVAKAPAAAPPPAAPKPAPLDLKSLEARLKDSNAIGVMTKLSLKNQVDDLVGRFRAYHNGERPPTLPQLRPSYELLLMKVLSLLQDKDPGLAHDIDASREAIWGLLSDRARFQQFT